MKKLINILIDFLKSIRNGQETSALSIKEEKQN